VKMPSLLTDAFVVVLLLQTVDTDPHEDASCHVVFRSPRRHCLRSVAVSAADHALRHNSSSDSGDEMQEYARAKPRCIRHNHTVWYNP
jgi:hypothetical protein